MFNVFLFLHIPRDDQVEEHWIYHPHQPTEYDFKSMP